jgi:UPF0755 protein
MPRGNRRMPIRRKWTIPLVLLIGLGLCIISWFSVVALFGIPNALQELGPPSTQLSQCEEFALSAYLLTFQDRLHQPAGNPSASLDLQVDEGETAGAVVAQLERVGIVSDGQLLRTFLRYRGLDRRVQAGHYQLSGEMTVVELAQALQRASPSKNSITVLEGWRREQIADLIDRHSLAFDGASFLAASLHPPPDSALEAELEGLPSLEGFLFPDTYQLQPDMQAQDLVAMMLEDFQNRVDPELRAGFAAQGLTLTQAVTLASIIEREAVIPEERPVIASVFLNRFRMGMRLEADPTVQYALGQQADGTWWKSALTADDLKEPSPYNTYLHAGLPPAPIANPGLASLQAVAFPAETGYYYFRARCDGSGEHIFSETFEEHLQNSCP